MPQCNFPVSHIIIVCEKHERLDFNFLVEMHVLFVYYTKFYSDLERASNIRFSIFLRPLIIKAADKASKSLSQYYAFPLLKTRKKKAAAASLAYKSI